MSLNPEATVICPYNKAHVIVLSRMQFHLSRCRAQYPSAEKVTCPFNTTHVVNKVELEWHLEWCTERISGEREFIKIGSAPLVNCNPPLETNLPPPPCLKEVWDDEVVGGESVLDRVKEAADSRLTLKNKICVSKSVRKEHKMNERRKFIEASNKAPESPTSPKTVMPPSKSAAVPAPQVSAPQKSEEYHVRSEDVATNVQPPVDKKTEPVQLPIRSQERKTELVQMPMKSQVEGSMNNETKTSNSDKPQPWNGWNKMMSNTDNVSQAMSGMKLNQEVDRLSQRNPNNPWGARLPQTAGGSNFSEDFPSLGLPVSGRGRRIQEAQFNQK